MESKTCYARGGVQYFFTGLFGILFIVQTTMPIWANVEINRNDYWIYILIDLVFALFFLYFVLQCIFFKVAVSEDKVVYTNILNRTRTIDVTEIINVDPIGGKGMKIKVNRIGITTYAFYQNYYEVRNEILQLIARKKS